MFQPSAVSPASVVLASDKSATARVIVEDDIEHGGRTTYNEEAVSVATLAVLDQFAAPEAGLLTDHSKQVSG